MAPVLRLPISVPNMGEFEQQLEKSKSLVGQAARSITKHFVQANTDISTVLRESAAVAGKTGGEYVGAAAKAVLSNQQLRAAAVATGQTVVATTVASTKATAAFAYEVGKGVSQTEGLAAGVSRLAVAVAGPLLAGAAVFAILGAAISTAREKLQEMVDIATRSNAVGVSPVFFQAFILGAEGAEKKVEALEAALKKAFDATKPQFKDDASVFDTSFEKITAVEKKLRDMRELFGDATDPTKFAGLDLFRNAKDQDQKILAVLAAMRELDNIGQHIAAMDIGETFFGSGFVEQVRTGQIELEKLRQTIENKSGLAGTGQIFSDEMVTRAREVDERLKAAHFELEQNLKPAWESLASAAASVKSEWVLIVQQMAKAAGYALEIARMPLPQLSGVVIDTGAGGDHLIPRPPPFRRFEGTGAYDPPEGTPTPAAVPLPRRRPRDIKEDAKSEAAEPSTSFEREEERLKRAIALEGANAAAVGKTNEQRMVMRAELALLQAAEKDGDNVTQEQIDTYARLRASMTQQQALAASGIQLTTEQAASFEKLTGRLGEAANAHKRAGDAFQGVNDSLRFGGNQLLSVLDSIGDRTKTASQIGQDALRALVREMLRAAILGEGAFAKLFGFASGTGGVGGIFGLLARLLGGGGGLSSAFTGSASLGTLPYGGPRAGGGPVYRGQRYLVGEKGPEWFEPHTSGQIRTGGDGAMVFAPVTHIDATGSDMSEAKMRMILAESHKRLLLQVRRDFPGRMAFFQKTGS